MAGGRVLVAGAGGRVQVAGAGGRGRWQVPGGRWQVAGCRWQVARAGGRGRWPGAEPEVQLLGSVSQKLMFVLKRYV